MRIFVGILALAVAGCGSSEASVEEQDDVAEAGTFSDEVTQSAYTPSAGSFLSDTDSKEFDEDAARERAEGEVGSEGYDYRYGCTDDCSGHEAGFSYAADGQVDAGVSSSPSFDEGQQAYEEAVEERVEELRQAHEDGEDL